MRVTMSMAMRQYANGLNKSFQDWMTASDREQTTRRYDKASEDPFSAAKATRLRQQYAENQSYQSEVASAADLFDFSHSIILSMNSTVTDATSGECLRALNGSNKDADILDTISKKLRGIQQTLLSQLNSKFGDKYVFGGADTSNPPFSIGANHNLLYRGIDVNTGKIEAGSTLSYNGAQITLGDSQFNGYKIQVNTADGATPAVSADVTNKVLTVNLPTGAKNSDVLAALKASQPLKSTDNSVTFDLSKVALSGDQNRPVDINAQTNTATDTIGLAGLKKLANEQVYCNIGLGLSEKTTVGADGNAINEQSVFNTAIPGISIVGFGTSDGTATGMPNNLYNLIGKIADRLEDKNSYSFNDLQEPINYLQSQQNMVTAKMTQTDANFSFLKATQSNLVAVGDKLSDEDDAVEHVDFETAYLNYTMQAYAYNAALKIGNQMLLPTFLDFMK
ncbi:hypothetical protein [Caproiciproducens galactitolivorans]|uniref:Flagellar hook-associated protein 3 n=1 Tax=Caproiciproducens galactitolivorans TaxID=642589 RepID=A0ABT4BSD9_9FIRM|nr:hypothetical protein [Caproiciproducens galactitolivorans]MCY1713018.1 hypothetical protein [Caproiciproducens galactitolivorans]